MPTTKTYSYGALELLSRLYDAGQVALGVFVSILIVIAVYQRLREKAASHQRKRP